MKRWIQGVVLSLLVCACGSVAFTAGPPTTDAGSEAVAAVIGVPAPALTSDFLDAGFVRIEPEPAEVRAVQGRPLVVALHVAQRGFARVSIFGDPVTRVIFSSATDDEALDAFRALLGDRGLVSALNWLEQQQMRAAADPTADISDQTVLSNGLAISYKREVAGNDPSTAVVTIIVGS